MKDNIVAILMSNPISESKKKKIPIVPKVSRTIQAKYPYLEDLLKSSSVDLFMALGEASNVVMVVLNMVVNAAMAMI